ncbi:MAG: hypothetical protein JNG84_09865 [Archangium sp.]|nr:hypothetical protein [Archangium sp.]
MLLAVTACDVPQLTPRERRDGGGADVASLTLSSPAERARVGDTVTLGVVALDAADQPVESPPLSWVVSDEYVLVVDAAGVGRALKEGSVTVSVRAGAVTSNEISLEVLPNAGAGQFSVRFVEQRVTLKRGTSRPVVAEVRDAAGNIRNEIVPVYRLEPDPGCCAYADGSLTASATGDATLIARTPEGAEGRLSLSAVDADDVLEVDWVGTASTFAADRRVPIEWEVRMADLSSTIGGGYPVVPDTLELFDGETKLQDLALQADGGLPVLDVAAREDGTVLRLSLRATRSGATAVSRVRDVVVRHPRDGGSPDAGWANVGVAQVDDDAWDHQLLIDDAGVPWVVYRREANAVRVNRLNMTTNRWERAARSVNGADRPTRAELTAMDAGRLSDGGYPSFREEVDALNTHVFSVQYNYWPRLWATAPSMAFDGQGRAVVVFGEEQPDDSFGLGAALNDRWNIRVKRLDVGGTTWNFLGGALESVSTEDCRVAQLAIDPSNGAPVVAMGCLDVITGMVGVEAATWSDATQAWARWGSKLPVSMRQREVRGAVFDGPDSLRLAIDEEGVATTWRLSRSGMWTQSPPAPAATVVGTPARLAAGGAPIGDGVVSVGSGSGWSRLGDIVDEQPLAWAADPRVALGRNDALVVAWREGDPRINLDLHVSRWNAEQLTWDRLGARLDFSIDAMALYHSVATGPTGTVYASWSEMQANGSPRLRVVRKRE